MALYNAWWKWGLSVSIDYQTIPRWSSKSYAVDERTGPSTYKEPVMGDERQWHMAILRSVLASPGRRLPSLNPATPLLTLLWVPH